MILKRSEKKNSSYLFDEDVKLMLDFQSGNNVSFETLLKKYFKRILNFIYRHVGDKALAEDLTQEVFIRVYQNKIKYSPKAQFKTWVYTIARNISINAIRKRKYNIISLDRTLNVDGEEIPVQVEDKKIPRPDEALINSETSKALKKALQLLPERQRTVIVLYRYEGLSYREIGYIMKITEKAVKSLIKRGRENLKNTLFGKI